MAEMATAGGTPLAYRCCTMAYDNHCHRFACSVMLQLGSRAPIAIKWPAAVLVMWPHFNGNAQRAAPARRQFGVGAVFFADMLFSMQKPRASKRKIKSAEGLPTNLGSSIIKFARALTE